MTLANLHKQRTLIVPLKHVALQLSKAITIWCPGGKGNRGERGRGEGGRRSGSFLCPLKTTPEIVPYRGDHA